MTEPSTETAPTRYSMGAILLHWVIAFALAFEMALGFAMPRSAEGFELFQLHKSVGIAILALTLVRLIWRLAHPRPAPVGLGLEHALARAVHAGFYIFMVLAPLTGWALVSTDSLNIPTVLFGAVPLPHLPLAETANGAMEEAHEWLAWCGIALFALHVAGALRHEIILRDRLLGRITPGGGRPLGGLLALGVLALGAISFVSIDGTAGPAERDGAPEPISAATDAEPSELAVPPPEASPADEEPGPIPVWTIRPGGSLAFAAGNGAAGTIRGSFAKWQGAIAFDPAQPETAEIRITVDLASASVGDATQDEMLAGDEFFAVDRFGTAVFSASSARRVGPDRYSASGTLELKGVSLPQTIRFSLAGQDLERTVQGSATIARKAFGIGEGSAGADLDADVAVSFDFDAVGRLPTR